MNRDPTNTSEYRQIKEEIEEDRISGYLSNLAESLRTGNPIESESSVSMGGLGPEPIHMEVDSLFSNAINALSPEDAKKALETDVPKSSGKMHKQAQLMPSLSVSKNQQKAIERFPALIDFLGQEDYGDKIASLIASTVHNMVVSKIENNTKTVNKYAHLCTSKNNNIKMYFKDAGWLCCVTASGPFRGDEIIQYDKQTDKQYILRRIGKKIEDVTDNFQVVREFSEEPAEEKANNSDNR